MTKNVMKTVILSFSFNASHSLEVRENIHNHKWVLHAGISGVPINGFVLNIIDARLAIQKIINELDGTYLNENSFVSNCVRSVPTCETLVDFFWQSIEKGIDKFMKLNSTIKIAFIEVAIFENDQEHGRVRREI